MGYGILLHANFRRHKGSLTGIFILALISAAVIGTVLSLWTNGDAYIRSEMNRAGFGDITAWVSGISDTSELAAEIEGLTGIERVETQKLIFSDYEANGVESDSEGQLITWLPEENRYRFFTDDLSGYIEQPVEIPRGKVYVSPSLVTMLGVKAGDGITFPIARSGKNVTLVVEGFYEDPFMGSSMIGMKGFLINEADRLLMLEVLEDAGIDALARDGAMLHIFSEGDGSVSRLNVMINRETSISKYSEFIHSSDAIAGFMVILQNSFCALLMAFAAVLMIVAATVIGHSISGTVMYETVNTGILKTIGYTSGRLRAIQFLTYLIPVAAGIGVGMILSVPLSVFTADAIITTTGIRIPSTLPVIASFLFFTILLLFFSVFVLLCTRKTARISPMNAIRRETKSEDFNPERTFCAFGQCLNLRLAFRQIVSGKRRYAGALITAVMLAFFASLIGRMDNWLGADGKGMMEAFNPADHDLGVQIFGTLTAEETEKTILAYSEIIDSYWLAMPSAAVNGIDLTVNVIDQPERFHILEGRTCSADDEVVLTEFVASDLGVGIGDKVTLRADRGGGDYTVSGIYSCANGMGDNIGMNREGYLKIGGDIPQLWCKHYFLSEPSRKGMIAEALETMYGGDVHVHENTWPGLFGIISAMRVLVTVMYVLTAAFILIVTVMTGNRIILQEQKDLGIYKAIGFDTIRIRISFALRFGITAAAGAICGVVLAAIFTDPIVSAVMKLAGISNFSSMFSADSILLPFGVVTMLFMAFAYLVSGRIQKNDLTILVAM